MNPLWMMTLPPRANMYPAPWGLWWNMVRMVDSSGWQMPDLETQMMHMMVSSFVCRI